MRSHSWLVFTLVLLLALPAARAEQASATDDRARLEAAIAALPIRDQGQAFLWRVQSKKKRHKGTAWVFGSIHVGIREMYPLDPVIDRAFEGADALVVEADIAAPGVELELAARMMASARLPEGVSLETLLPERYPELKDALAQFMIPWIIVNPLKPFMASMMLSLMELQRAGWDAAWGIDRRFLDAARGTKEIVELEGVEFQLQVFETMPLDVQVAMLVGGLDFVGLTDVWTRRAWDAIVAGDGEALAALAELESGGGDDPALAEFNEILLGRRNIGMAARIVEHVTKGQGDWFVVVGALHVPGEDGLIDLLDDRRFLRVQQQPRAAATR